MQKCATTYHHPFKICPLSGVLAEELEFLLTDTDTRIRDGTSLKFSGSSLNRAGSGAWYISKI